jgi:hypothetical protein
VVKKLIRVSHKVYVVGPGFKPEVVSSMAIKEIQVQICLLHRGWFLLHWKPGTLRSRC